MHFRLNILAGALLTLPLALPAQAETSSTPSSSNSATELATVDVFAERSGSFKSGTIQVGTFRDMAPIDVPQSSNTVTREVLDAQAENTLYGALRNTAGVTRAELGGANYDNIAIRGIVVENRGNYRLNGSLPIINLVDTPLQNKERVEVLKGASSLYYGLIPPSGVVNLVTKRAGKIPVATAEVSANQHGGAEAYLDVGSKFGDRRQYGARINVGGGEVDNGMDNYSGSKSLASIALDWQATDDLSLKMDMEHYAKSASEPALISTQTTAIKTGRTGFTVMPGNPDSRRNLAGEWQKYDAQADNVLLRADYAINDNWSAMIEAGKAKTERERRLGIFKFDTINSVATGEGRLHIYENVGANGQLYENENYRAELFGRLPGQRVTHEVTVGVTANERFNSFPTPRATPKEGVPQNYYNPVAIGENQPLSGGGTARSNVIDDKGWYVADRILLGGEWQAMVGVRGTDYTSETRNGTTAERFAANVTNPSAALLYKATDRLSVYGSYLEGIEELKNAPTTATNAGAMVPPAVTKQREIGIKAEVAQGMLVQAAFFDINRATAHTDPETGIYGANGRADYQGIELTAAGEVSKRLSLIGSLTLMDAKQVSGAADTVGKIPENTAERTASLFGEYRPAKVPGLALSGGLYYTGERPINNTHQTDDNSRPFIGGYTTASVGARYTTQLSGKRTTFQAVVDNVTDKDYWSTAGNSFVGAGAPRTLKMSAKMEF